MKKEKATDALASTMLCYDLYGAIFYALFQNCTPGDFRKSEDLTLELFCCYHDLLLNKRQGMSTPFTSLLTLYRLLLQENQMETASD